MKRKSVYFLILEILIILALTGCKEDNEQLKIEKIQSEINFLENQCMSIFNRYMEEEYFGEDISIDWQKVEEDYIILNQATDVILIDMASLPISSNDLIELENNFNRMNEAFQNQNIKEFMEKICETYELISTIIFESVSSNKLEKQEKKTKSKLIYVGYHLSFLDKEETLEALEEFKDTYSRLSKNMEYLDNSAYKMNRIYVIMQRIKSFVEIENWSGAKEELLEIMNFFK